MTVLAAVNWTLFWNHSRFNNSHFLTNGQIQNQSVKFNGSDLCSRAKYCIKILETPCVTAKSTCKTISLIILTLVLYDQLYFISQHNQHCKCSHQLMPYPKITHCMNCSLFQAMYIFRCSLYHLGFHCIFAHYEVNFPADRDDTLIAQ